MANILLPRWIITQMTMPGGRRTSPKPVLVVPVEHHIAGIRTNPFKVGSYNPPEIDKVFEKWEYRFWCMCTWPPAMQFLAECRCCGHIGEQDIKIRQGHFKQGGCTKKLVAAYALLLKDMKCVICDHRSVGAKWGVPICSSACAEAWCEQEPQPKALTAALELVGNIA